MGDEPMKLQLLSNSNGVLATELVGVDDDYQTFSYAYRFTTNQGGFLCRRYDVFDAEKCKPSPEWLGKHDISEWTPASRDFQKQWQQMVKDELLSCRKDLLSNTLHHFRDLCKDNPDTKEALRDLVLVDDEDVDSVVNNFTGEFKRTKLTEKIWKSVKL
ncbi:hypothetical protein NSK_007329 [Nannochloropsis salina CCMP1776]|uniref:Uncharacterized protein n=1 Tax=Nannochloropsis salina CCMP1776 TaxID=1027361 RepID=A0A4D9CY35_9STRA|nr:hypothetical protein NSK_007329 [Nannochloropsis salina CCMP1776]|eukprot:TFJ81368.1 hypothetical protein NSK_007329 [Nannochloropsis salina CCMP1776]